MGTAVDSPTTISQCIDDRLKLRAVRLNFTRFFHTAGIPNGGIFVDKTTAVNFPSIKSYNYHEFRHLSLLLSLSGLFLTMRNATPKNIPHFTS